MERSFPISGICLVPTNVEMTVIAESKEAALEKALSDPWRQSIDDRSGDNASAFDWEPTAKEI